MIRKASVRILFLLHPSDFILSSSVHPIFRLGRLRLACFLLRAWMEPRARDGAIPRRATRGCEGEACDRFAARNCLSMRIKPADSSRRAWLARLPSVRRGCLSKRHEFLPARWGQRRENAKSAGIGYQSVQGHNVLIGLAIERA